MHRFPTKQTVLLIVQASILLGLVLLISLTGLVRTYPWFFGYLMVASVQILPSPFLAYDSVSYLNYWLVTQALLTFFCALIVLELYALVLSDLTGLATASRRYFATWSSIRSAMPCTSWLRPAFFWSSISAIPGVASSVQSRSPHRLYLCCFGSRA